MATWQQAAGWHGGHAVPQPRKPLREHQLTPWVGVLSPAGARATSVTHRRTFTHGEFLLRGWAPEAPRQPRATPATHRRIRQVRKKARLLAGERRGARDALPLTMATLHEQRRPRGTIHRNKPTVPPRREVEISEDGQTQGAKPASSRFPLMELEKRGVDRSASSIAYCRARPLLKLCCGHCHSCPACAAPRLPARGVFRPKK